MFIPIPIPIPPLSSVKNAVKIKIIQVHIHMVISKWGNIRFVFYVSKGQKASFPNGPLPPQARIKLDCTPVESGLSVFHFRYLWPQCSILRCHGSVQSRHYC